MTPLPESNKELEAIWKELPNCGNPRCLPYRSSKGEFHPKSLCRVCDAAIGGVLALIATHDLALRDKVLELLPDLPPMDNEYNIIVTKEHRQLRADVMQIWGEV